MSVIERVSLRFYADDIDLIQWLKEIPEGGKNQALKSMIRLGIRASNYDLFDHDVIRQVVREALDETQSALINAASASAPDLDQDFVRQAIQETMQDVVTELPGKSANGVVIDAIPFDLADIRQVVEAALQEHADRLGGAAASPVEADKNDADEVDVLIDVFGQSVIR